MTSPQVPAALRRLVRERAALQCEYCLLAEDDAFLPHEPDPIVAQKHGGATDASNLALACFACNRYKGTPSARVTVTLLRLNLPARVEVREELASLGRWPIAPRAP